MFKRNSLSRFLGAIDPAARARPGPSTACAVDQGPMPGSFDAVTRSARHLRRGRRSRRSRSSQKFDDQAERSRPAPSGDRHDPIARCSIRPAIFARRARRVGRAGALSQCDRRRSSAPKRRIARAPAEPAPARSCRSPRPESDAGFANRRPRLHEAGPSHAGVSSPLIMREGRQFEDKSRAGAVPRRLVVRVRADSAATRAASASPDDSSPISVRHGPR